MMKNAFLTLLLVLLAASLSAQRAFDLESARKMALANNKMIILDFWASWCGPCRTMDAELWNTPEFTELMDRFVFVRIDIDANQALAQQYSVRSIPRVVVITPNDDRLFDQSGFGGAGMYLDAFRSFPPDNEDLNESLIALRTVDEPKATHFLAVGEDMQRIGYGIEDTKTKIKFLSVSDQYFKRAEKKAQTTAEEQEAQLAQLLNDAYLGKHKKVLKKIDKGDFSESEARLTNLKNYVLAYCYECVGQKEKAQKAKGKITDRALLARLPE